MNDLISREALIEAFKAWKTTDDYYHNTDCNDIPFSEAFDLIDNAPTVDIKDELAGAYNEGYMCGNREAEKARLQGEWIDTDSEWLDYKCNKCGWRSTREHNYCPNCGADMRGAE